MTSELTKAAPQDVQRAQPTMLDMIHQAITSGDVPAEKLPGVLQAFFDFKLRVDAVDAEKAFNQDFAAAMMEMPRVVKRGKKDMKEKGVIAYETYEDLDGAIRPIETAHGFARSFATRSGDKSGVILTLRLTHRGGHSITSERYCPPDAGPGRNETQAIGSGESYGRRYLTKSIWNIVTIGADDDANTADPISEEQALTLRGMLDYLAPTPKWYTQFWAWVAAPENKVEAIQRSSYQRVHDDLARRVKAQEVQR